MSLSARPLSITTYDKTTNIYVLVTFCIDSWRRPWEDAIRSRLWSSDGPPFHHLWHGRLKRYDSLWLTGVSYAPTCWDVGSSRLPAALDFPLRESRLCRRPTWHTAFYEEALVLASTRGGALSTGLGPLDDPNIETLALRLEPILGSNSLVSNIHVVLYSLFNTLR